MDADAIGAFEKFLQWGPLGLAGLMLVLVIFTLVTTTLSTRKAVLLGLFMVVGAGCFVTALLYDNTGQHRLVVAVLPNDLEGFDFPPPRILKNGAAISRDEEVMINEPTSLTVDVSRALGAFRESDEAAEAAAARAAEALAQEQEALASLQSIEQQVVASQQELERTNAMLVEARLEVEAQEVRLKEAEDVIVVQSAALEEAADASSTLVSEIATLKNEIDRVPAVAASPAIQRRVLELQDDAQSITRGLELGVFR
ncbi:hypothetical protein MWU60_13210 [Yoonia sp. F2084L]|uniref:hypothetical protein n=1 Tax=Yoonia sp. F2084L TaxID=2926419 RepID=UPI001FF4F51E|nr:hypothetical protein [Yoonia sp. F2084L]MCK0096534.1 hypothetical protein [Yoonia sp. F2084L]